MSVATGGQSDDQPLFPLEVRSTLTPRTVEVTFPVLSRSGTDPKTDPFGPFGVETTTRCLRGVGRV